MISTLVPTLAVAVGVPLAVAVGVPLAVHGNNAAAVIIAAGVLLMTVAAIRVLGFGRR